MTEKNDRSILIPKLKRTLNVLLVACMLFVLTGCGTSESKNNADSDSTEKPIVTDGSENNNSSSSDHNSANIQDSSQNETQGSEDDPKDNNVKKGDLITFGTYEQDNDTANGKEDIQWVVLDQKDDQLLVISRYILDTKKYNETGTRGEEITWESSTIRKWLNDDFINEAFSDEEQTRIMTIQVKAEINPEYDIDPGNDTNDKIFLPSIEDVCNKYFSSNDERICGATKYAIAQGAATYDKYMDGEYVSSVWWLRNPGAGYHDFAEVAYDGFVNKDGVGVLLTAVGVRPMMWIKAE